MNEPLNPYAAPTSVASAPTSFEPHDLPPPNLGKVILKWLVICSVAAGPSFVMGGDMGGWSTSAVFGMICGVLLFVLAYSVVEFMPHVQRLLRRRFARRTSWVGYGSRIAVSVVFPIGLMLDIFCGIMSVGITNQFGGLNNLGSDVGRVQEHAGNVFVFFSFLFTTIVQGILLNVVLFTYMLLVYGICWMIASFRDRPTPHVS